MTIDKWFEQFLQEKRYLENVSQHTIAFYKQSFKAFNLQEPLTQSQINEKLTALRAGGKSAGCCDAYVRGINSYLTWLHENGHTTERLKAKRPKLEKRVKKTFSDTQLRTIFLFKPRSFYEHRLHTLLCLLADTGIRINEALTLKRSKVDFDNLLLTVAGKGNKERVLPFSFECRKVLYKYLAKHQFDLVFCTRHGSKLLYDNTRRDFNKLMETLGIEGFEGSFHAFRRAFAKSYLRRGGNLIYLRQVMGHSSVKTTEAYIEVEVEALRETHSRVSMLENVH